MNVERTELPTVVITPEVPEIPPATAPQEHFWQHRTVQNVIPFLSSLAIHTSIIVLGVLTIKVVHSATRNIEAMTSPADSPIEPMLPGVDVIENVKGPRDVDYSSFQDVDQNINPGWNKDKGVDLSSLAPGAEGSGDLADDGLIGFAAANGGIGKNKHGPGDGGDGGPQAPFGIPRIGGQRDGIFGPGPKSPPRLVRSVAYVCDASGSMLNNFDDLRNQINKSVTGLKAIQAFNVIFFQGDTAASANKGGLLLASPQNKRMTAQFLDDIAPASTTDPLPALELAFKQKPELIWLLTDGDFPDNNAVVEFIRRHNPEKKIQVNTIAFVNRGDDYERVLKAIADENRGEFKYVNEETLGK